MSWPHNAGGPLSLLTQGLRITLSAPLNQGVLNTAPQVVQVWFEPNGANGAGSGPVPLLVLHGVLRFEAPTRILWASTDPADLLKRTTVGGGRVLIRVHCSNLLDERALPFSSSTDALIGVTTPHLPGGVFESWFFLG